MLRSSNGAKTVSGPPLSPLHESVSFLKAQSWTEPKYKISLDLMKILTSNLTVTHVHIIQGFVVFYVPDLIYKGIVFNLLTVRCVGNLKDKKSNTDNQINRYSRLYISDIS